MKIETSRFVNAGVALAALGLLTLGTPATAATVIFGNPAPSTINDCTPGCTPSFQTVYGGAAFGTSPVSISAITYYLANFAGVPNAETYTIKLSTSVNSVGNLSAVFASNVGADVATFYAGVPNVPNVNGFFTFTGTPFTYDPTAGDLLVDIQTTGANSIFASYDGWPINAQRAFGFGVNDTVAYSVDMGYAIATQFTVGPSGAVPEPASWALMITGFGLTGAALRRRRLATA